jgi:hypothetical protein
MKSISPASSAFTACCWSEIASHSTRSTLAILPPARPDAGSERGLYLSNLTYTVLSPGFHSSRLKTKGPEPVKSEICVFGSVSATRFGIMKGTAEDGLPRPESTSPVGSFSLIVKVFGSLAVMDSTKLMSFWPSASLAPQRLIEAMQSSAVTGWPSCQRRPSRSAKV